MPRYIVRGNNNIEDISGSFVVDLPRAKEVRLLGEKIYVLYVRYQKVLLEREERGR